MEMQITVVAKKGLFFEKFFCKKYKFPIEIIKNRM